MTGKGTTPNSPGKEIELIGKPEIGRPFEYRK